jgi:hypothetical protein
MERIILSAVGLRRPDPGSSRPEDRDGPSPHQANRRLSAEDAGGRQHGRHADGAGRGGGEITPIQKQ